MRKRRVCAVIPPRAAAQTAATHLGRRRLLLAVLVVGAAALLVRGLVPSAGEDPSGGAPRVQVLSDCEGAITDWCLSLPAASTAFFLPTQVELVARADPAIRFHVLYDRDAVRREFDQALRREGRDLERRVTWHRTQTQVWPWTRDLFLAARAADGAPVTLLHHPEHYAIWKTAPSHGQMGLFAAMLDGGRVVQTPARIEGGSIVVGSERVLASTALVERSAHRRPAEVKRQMEGIWGRPIDLVDVGSVHLSGHGDLVMMPAGRRRLVLASPILGAELLRATTPGDRARFAAACRHFAARVPGHEGAAALARRDLVGDLLVQNSRPDLQRAYDRLRRRLRDLGYRCVEVPGLTLDPRIGGLAASFSYANAVIDGRRKRPTVYLPTFRLPRLDSYAIDAWRELGYRVVHVDAIGPALNGGALHCLSQVFRAAPDTRLPRPPH